MTWASNNRASKNLLPGNDPSSAVNYRVAGGTANHHSTQVIGFNGVELCSWTHRPMYGWMFRVGSITHWKRIKVMLIALIEDPLWGAQPARRRSGKLIR